MSLLGGSEGRFESLRSQKDSSLNKVSRLLNQVRKAREEAEKTIEETEEMKEELNSIQSEAEQVKHFCNSFDASWTGEA